MDGTLNNAWGNETMPNNLKLDVIIKFTNLIRSSLKLLNDGGKRNRLPHLKIMYIAIRKISHLHIFW